MAGSTHRSYEAGKAIGKAIIEMVHLMYQNETAMKFYCGLDEEISKEMSVRNVKTQAKREVKS